MFGPNKPELKLTEESDNAFAIIARARETGRKAGWSDAELDAFTEKATTGDYYHVLLTVMEYFDVC